MNLSAALGVAVREFPLKTGFADYLLYADGRAVGIVEAKPEGHTLTGVEVQSAKYAEGLPAELPHYRLPLPFAYESTGTVTRFTNGLNPDPRSREVFTFHRPEELIRMALLDGGPLRSNLRDMAPLDETRIWPVHVEAVRNLERSLADTAQTVGFFGGNVVQDYSHERAVADRVNVGYDVHRGGVEGGVSGVYAWTDQEPN